MSHDETYAAYVTKHQLLGSPPENIHPEHSWRLFPLERQQAMINVLARRLQRKGIILDAPATTGDAW